MSYIGKCTNVVKAIEDVVFSIIYSQTRTKSSHGKSLTLWIL